MSERTCEQVTLDAPDLLTFSEEDGEVETMAERPARLLEVGDYPDKALTLTPADLDALAVRFMEAGASGVPVKVEHVDSPLDPLGSVRRVWREGNALLATLAFPTDLAAFLRRRGAAKLSVGLTRDPLRLREVSLVLKPRVASATLMSVEEGAGGTPEVVRLRAELASRDVEAHLAAFKAQGRIVPASEGPARVLLAAMGEAVVTLSDGSEPIGRIFRRFLEAQPPAVLLSEVSPSGPTEGDGAWTPEEHTFLSERLGVDPALVSARLRLDGQREKSHAS